MVHGSAQKKRGRERGGKWKGGEKPYDIHCGQILEGKVKRGMK